MKSCWNYADLHHIKFWYLFCNFAFTLCKRHCNIQCFPLSDFFFFFAQLENLPWMIYVSKEKELEFGQTVLWIAWHQALKQMIDFSFGGNISMTKIRILWAEKYLSKVHWNIIKSDFAQNHTQNNHRGYLNIDDLNVQLLEHEKFWLQ